MADRPINRQTVLLVDDEPVITDVFALYLGRSGLSVVVAYDGAEGLDVHEKIKLDTVITDVMMLQLDGRQLVREVHARGGWTLIILLTQIDQSYEHSAALDEGADDYLSKPSDPQELASRIRAVL